MEKPDTIGKIEQDPQPKDLETRSKKDTLCTAQTMVVPTRLYAPSKEERLDNPIFVKEGPNGPQMFISNSINCRKNSYPSRINWTRNWLSARPKPLPEEDILC